MRGRGRPRSFLVKALDEMTAKRACLKMQKSIRQAGLLLGLVLGLFTRPSPGLAQNDGISLDDVVQAAQQWARENLDEDALRVLEQVDQDKVKQFFADVQKQFHGEYVLDLALLKDQARTLLPVLERYEETSPYAAWLKTRLDYLEVAEQMRLSRPPPPKNKPNEPARPPSNPAPQIEREIWIKKLEERPWPKQAKPYVSRLKPVFTSQKVPSELIWIAEVESSFDPRARSPDGATGLFQLMPATAKRFGLSVRPVDDRLKPEESAEAAAKYLGFLHRHYKDWRLALAAYNAGEGNVDKLLTRYKAHSFDSIATHLPAETQMYVPKIEAVLLRREGLKLSQLDSPPGL
jgi:membrane-bound lytic murein transglycosylase D